MVEFMFSGRGGQGVVMAHEIFAKALFYQGYQVKAFPSFGPERRGAPVSAFVRVSTKPIRLGYQVYHPDYAVVFHNSQTKNIPGNPEMLINTHVKIKQQKKFSIDANHIALQNQLGTDTNPIINTAMLGALAGLITDLDFSNLEKAITESVPASVCEMNLNSTKTAYQKIQSIKNSPTWSLKSC